MATLSTRELQPSDVELIATYWATSTPDFLHSMGADINKLPSKEELIARLSEQLTQPYPEKNSYAIIWLADGEPIGHCNVNKITFGEEAYMHLHLWHPHTRQKGAGAELVTQSIPYFFKNLQLKNLYCEPWALNPSPNKTLEKVGFSFVKQYLTIPNYVNFEQQVNLWQLPLEKAKTFDNKAN